MPRVPARTRGGRLGAAREGGRSLGAATGGGFENVIQYLSDEELILYGDCTEWEIKKLERLAERLGMEDAEA